MVPWHPPGEQGKPRNLVTQTPYRGVNVFLTASAGFASPDWLTLTQAHALGGSVRRGERGTPVICWTWLEYAADGAEGDPRRLPWRRSYAVFTLAQCRGIEAPVEPDKPAFLG